MKPSDGAPTSPLTRLLASIASLLGLGLVVILVLLRQNRPSGPAPPPPGRVPVQNPAETAQDRQAERPRITPPRVRDSAPVLVFPPRSDRPPTVQDLPDSAELSDPAARDAARRQAEQIYARQDAAPGIRAEAAYAVARVHREEGRWTEARKWAERALAMNARAEQGPERIRRAETYRSFLERLPQNPGPDRT